MILSPTRRTKSAVIFMTSDMFCLLSDNLSTVPSSTYLSLLLSEIAYAYVGEAKGTDGLYYDRAVYLPLGLK